MSLSKPERRFLAQVGFGVAIALVCGAVDAQPFPSAPSDFVEARPLRSPQHIRYGANVRQQAYLYDLPHKALQPLVLVIGDGDWHHLGPKLDTGDLYSSLAYAGISVVWVGRHDPFYDGWRTSIRDVTQATAKLIAEADRDRIDPHCIILIGIGTGAAEAAALGTNPAFWRDAGVEFANIRGVVLITPDGLISPEVTTRQSKLSAREAQRLFPDRDDYAALSPMAQVGAPDAPAFLFLDHRLAHPEEAAQLATALRDAGARIETGEVPESRVGVSQTRIGSPSSAAGNQIRTFVLAAVGR